VTKAFVLITGMRNFAPRNFAELRKWGLEVKLTSNIHLGLHLALELLARVIPIFNKLQRLIIG